MSERRWLTREEIAEIHVQRAKIAEQEYMRKCSDPEMDGLAKFALQEELVAKAAKCLDTASDILDIEELYKPVGSRFA